MKAIILSEYGGPDLFRLVEMTAPRPKSGELLVRVHALAVDPGNVKRASGAMRGIMPQLEFLG